MKRLLGRLLQRADLKKSGASADVRVLYVANAYIPTLQLSFVKPLCVEVESGNVCTELLSDEQIKDLFSQRQKSEVTEWIVSRFDTFRPTHVVFCRYSGPYYREIYEKAANIGAAKIYHIDDDLLNVPKEIGIKKYEFHNNPKRIESVKFLLKNSDLVYCSTDPLAQRLSDLVERDNTHFISGKIYCSANDFVLPTETSNLTKIGYMGFDHAADLESVLPAIEKLLIAYPKLHFELFGGVPIPESLRPFEDRIRHIPPVGDYKAFSAQMEKLGWSVGICPLTDSPFNKLKANTKWVEYSCSGIAVVASRNTIYDDCCSNGCGILAETSDEWFEAIKRLLDEPEARQKMIMNAQSKVKNEYSITQLRDQVMEILSLASVRAKQSN